MLTDDFQVVRRCSLSHLSALSSCLHRPPRYGASLKGPVRFKGRWWRIVLGVLGGLFLGVPLFVEGVRSLSSETLLEKYKFTQQGHITEVWPLISDFLVRSDLF